MFRMLCNTGRAAVLTLAGIGLAACDGVGGGAYYRYDDSLYWNDYYYYGYGRPDRPQRPEGVVPPIGTAPARPVPPVGMAPRPTPRIGMASRPMPRVATPPRISAPMARPARAR